MSKFFYTAIASNAAGSKIKSHLDDRNELNEFADRMERKGYLNLKVDFFNCAGFVGYKTLVYNGESWDLIERVPGKVGFNSKRSNY